MAADFDHGVIPAQVRTEFAARGLPLTESASVQMLTPSVRWEIVSDRAEYPVAATGDVLDVYCLNRQDVATTYDTATGFLIGQDTAHLGSSGISQQIRRTLLPPGGCRSTRAWPLRGC